MEDISSLVKENKILTNLKKDVLLGLTSNPKRIPSKYFYDEKGSKLFERIMELPEYYPTACETEIFH
jgi:L-histidine N-alpha-methyltransferase